METSIESVIQVGQVDNMPHTIRLRSSGREIIASGSAQTFDGTDLEFSLYQLTLILEFKDDELKLQRIDHQVFDNGVLKLVLYNFNSNIGTGLTEPISLGNMSGKQLYFSFVVVGLGKSPLKTVHYCFFIESEDQQKTDSEEVNTPT